MTSARGTLDWHARRADHVRRGVRRHGGVRRAGPVVIGAGVRAAKILVDGAALAGLPGARVLDLTR